MESRRQSPGGSHRSRRGVGSSPLQPTASPPGPGLRPPPAPVVWEQAGSTPAAGPQYGAPGPKRSPGRSRGAGALGAAGHISPRRQRNQSGLWPLLTWGRREPQGPRGQCPFPSPGHSHLESRQGIQVNDHVRILLKPWGLFPNQGAMGGSRWLKPQALSPQVPQLVTELPWTSCPSRRVARTRPQRTGSQSWPLTLGLAAHMDGPP